MVESIHLLKAGYCLQREAMTVWGGSWSRVEYPAGFALIHHAKLGPILFDTGYSEHFYPATAHWPGSMYARVTEVRLEDGQSAVAQLGAVGIAAGDVRWIVISHFHADHIAGLRDFPTARVLCGRGAWEGARSSRGLRGVARGILPGLLPADIQGRLKFVEDCPAAAMDDAFAPFGVCRDLFSDGSMIVVNLPGHGVGQIGLFMPGAAGGPLFLVADAAWSRRAIEEGIAAPSLPAAMLGNLRDYGRTFGRLHALHKAMPGILMIPSHDREMVVGNVEVRSASLVSQ